MSIEYTPVDLACNLKCTYCYQEPMRDAGNIADPADWERAKAALLKHNYQFSVFGGEPLLASIEHLEEVFKFGYEKFGQNGIQTNGTLITNAHIDLFKRYKVGVGISCDGPGECSSLRRDATDDATRLSTDATLSAIKRLCREGLTPSLIVTVHKLNASFFRRPLLINWLAELEELGITDINLHMLEVEKGMEQYALPEHENVGAFSQLYEFSKSSSIRFQPFRDIQRLLLDTERDKVNCIWNACDPLTTRAVQGVSRKGTLHNCGRTNKDGVNWVKADTPGRERYLVLRLTPQENGGCKDCRFFVFCKGNCPGTAIDGDWRNRSVHCATWFYLFSRIERDIIADRRMPVSKDVVRMAELENQLLDGENQHLDTPHIDTPHLDEHGDSNVGTEVQWLNV